MQAFCYNRGRRNRAAANDWNSTTFNQTLSKPAKSSCSAGAGELLPPPIAKVPPFPPVFQAPEGKKAGVGDQGSGVGDQGSVEVIDSRLPTPDSPNPDSPTPDS